jgi:hypothetical protein
VRIWLVVVALGVVVAACADVGDDGLSGGYLAVVSESTVEAQHARVAFGSDDDLQSASFEGVVDLTTGDLDLRGTLPVPEAAMGEGLDDDGEVVVLGDPEPVEVHIVVVDHTAYFAAAGLGGDGYVTSPVAAQPAGAQGVPAADPAALLDALAAEGAVAEDAGAGEVRGDATTRFRIESTIAAGQRRQGVQIPPGTILDDVTQTLVLDIDDEDRLRRVAVTAPDITSVNGSIEVGEEMTTTWWELWDFGVDATIQAPSPVVEHNDAAAGHSLSSADDPFPLIPSSGSSGGSEGRWEFQRHVAAIGATAAEAVARVVDDQIALLTGAGWTVTEEPDSTPERRAFSIADTTRTGELVIAFHPEGANVTLEGHVEG